MFGTVVLLVCSVAAIRLLVFIYSFSYAIGGKLRHPENPNSSKLSSPSQFLSTTAKASTGSMGPPLFEERGCLGCEGLRCFQKSRVRDNTGIRSAYSMILHLYAMEECGTSVDR